MMTFRTLIRRSLRFHWRAHLGVVIGAAIGSAALTGALVVGDSVKGSLRHQALSRLGKVTHALSSGDRWFRAELADDLGAVVRDRQSQSVSVTPALLVRGSVRLSDGSARVNHVSVVGIEPESWGRLTDFGASVPELARDEAWLSRTLAGHLGVSPGQVLVVRVPKVSALPQEAVLARRDEATLTLRLRCAGVMDDRQLGSFSLQTTPGGAMNVFVALSTLQEAMNRAGAANHLLVAGNEPKADRSRYDSYLRVALEDALGDRWHLQDTESFFTSTPAGEVTLHTPRIFLDPPIERAALAADTNAQPLLTYIANLITSGTNATPYSMVTAAGAPWTPADLADDEIVLNQWLADDLRAGPGDVVALVYFDPESGARLVERTNTFRVHSVVPMELPWADRTLMPEFPGIEDADTAHDWKGGFPLVHKIRDKDDDYWRQWRGTPKAFVSLAAGRKMWGNRFGALTAVRFPVPTNSGPALTPALSPGEREARQSVQQIPEADRSQPISTGNQPTTQFSPRPAGEGQGEPIEAFRAALEQKVLSDLDPAELGLRFEPVREQALRAAGQSQDFGGLFIGFSLFLIAAALILMALLFQFGLEQRSAEVGTLLALGFTPKQVRRLLIGEGAALAFVGGVIGTVGGGFYARAMLLGLTTVWSDAVGGTMLGFFVTPVSLGTGLIASTLVALFTLWLALRKQARQPAMRLLNAQGGGWMDETVRSKQRRGWVHLLTNTATIAGVSLAVAAGLVVWALATGETANAGVFFGAGALVLIGALALAGWLLNQVTGGPTRGGRVRPARSDEAAGDPRMSDRPAGRRKQVGMSLAGLALRGLARRRSRSVATMALLACGAFLILSIGVFRLDAHRDATQPTSGTGGFALIGEATVPVVHDLNTQAGRDFFALEDQDLSGVNVVPFRVRAGDEASCLNLNRAQRPRLLGVKPEALAGRFTFAKVAKGLDAAQGWGLLKSDVQGPKSEEEVPAIGDLNSILWAMGKKVGDTIDYTDDRGRPFKVRIVGAVANSILQGNLIIDEARFVERFPDASGSQYFLMDAPVDQQAQVSATLSRALQDYGLEMTPAARRLDEFNAVQNTYLGTFQILGGLGLLLGSAGLGIVVLRNVLERRGELAVLMAVGYRKRAIARWVMLEHGALLGLGLAIGVVAAAVAVMPSLLAPATQLPYATLVPTLLAVLANGLFWTWAATRVAVRGNLLEALRNE